MRRITIAILLCLFFIIGISYIFSNNDIVYAAIDDSSYINSFENVPSEEDNCIHYYEESVLPASVTKDGSIVRTCSKCGDIEETVINRITRIELSETLYEYDGLRKKPTVVIYDSEDNTVSSSYYKLSYQKGRKKPGRYSITISFADRYIGTVVEYFCIAPKSAVINDIKGGQGQLSFSISPTGKIYSGYQVQYSRTKDFSDHNGIKTYFTEKESYALNNLDTNIRYYVRVRTYILSDGKRVYSNWSEPVSARTKIYTNMNIVSTDHQKYNYKEMVRDISRLQRRYKDHCKVNIIGTSADNRNLYEVIVGNPNADKHLIVIASMHGREYMTMQLAMKQIEYYLNYYNKKINGIKVSSVLDKVAIHFVPSCNPDGVAISQYGFYAIRNNRLRNRLIKMDGTARKWKANARGVDLNRNWDINFEVEGTRGSSGYSGKKPFSEPELKAVVGMLDRIETEGDIVGFISYHAMGEVVYGMCNEAAGEEMCETVNNMYKVANEQSGYYLYGTTDISCNQSREYLLYKRGIPGITIEIGSSETPLVLSEFERAWIRNRKLVFLEAALFTE